MKKYLFLTLLCLFTIIIILIPKDFIPDSGEIEYEIINEKEKYSIYYINDENLISIPLVNKDTDKYELIFEVYKYLTEKSNSASIDYITCLNLNSKLLTYEIIGNHLYLDVTDNFLDIPDDYITFAYAQLYYSYKEIGYSKVYVRINGQII